jgi:hypothetical protein
MTQGRDFSQIPFTAPTDEEKETLLDAVGEVFKFWVESKDGVVTWRTIDAAAKRHKISPSLLGFVWQGVGFREKRSLGLDERTRAIMLFFSLRRNRQWIER